MLRTFFTLLLFTDGKIRLKGKLCVRLKKRDHEHRSLGFGRKIRKTRATVRKIYDMICDNSSLFLTVSFLQVCRVTFATGYCSAHQAINARFSPTLPTTAVLLSATLTTATTTASVPTIQANLQSAGNHTHTQTGALMLTLLLTQFWFPL